MPSVSYDFWVDFNRTFNKTAVTESVYLYPPWIYKAVGENSPSPLGRAPPPPGH